MAQTWPTCMSNVTSYLFFFSFCSARHDLSRPSCFPTRDCEKDFFFLFPPTSNCKTPDSFVGLSASSPGGESPFLRHRFWVGGFFLCDLSSVHSDVMSPHTPFFKRKEYQLLDVYFLFALGWRRDQPFFFSPFLLLTVAVVVFFFCNILLTSFPKTWTLR